MIAAGITQINILNGAFILWLNQFSQISVSFNQFVEFVSLSPLTKGIPIMGLLWYFWFQDTDNAGKNRRLIVGALLGCFIALFLARVINNVIFHPRPIAMASLHFQPLLGIKPIEEQAKFFQHSFPSDHATLFFSLATAIYLLSRRAGIAALIYVSIVICLPRMFLGLHFPIDILGGTLLGVGCVILTLSAPVRRLYEPRASHVLAKYPAGFQAILFMLSVEMCFLFDDVRHLLKGLLTFLV